MPEQQKTIKIGGLAIKECISRNNIRYIDEELSIAAPELIDVPILLDHESKTLSTVGRTTKSEHSNKETHYEGWAKGDIICEMIEDERIKSCSIGAFCQNLTKDSEDDEVLTARGIHYLEISFTPTPGIVGASVQQIIAQQEKIKLGEKIKMTPLIETFNIKETDSGTEGKIKITKTVDGSGKDPKDTVAGTDLGKDKLQIKCPLCDELNDSVDGFEKHLMSKHDKTDVQVDDYLHKAGLKHENSKHEEGETGIHKGNNPGSLEGKPEDVPRKEAVEVPIKEPEAYSVNPEEPPKKITIDPDALLDEIKKQKAEHPELDIDTLIKISLDHLAKGGNLESYFATMIESIKQKFKEEKMVNEIYGEPSDKPVAPSSQKPSDDKGAGIAAPTEQPDVVPAVSPFKSKEEEEAFKQKLAFIMKKKEEECAEALPVPKDDEGEEGEKKMTAEESIEIKNLKEQISKLSNKVTEMTQKVVETKGIVPAKTSTLAEQGYRLDVFESVPCFYRVPDGPNGTYKKK